MLIDIDCIDQSMKIDTHNFSSQNQVIYFITGHPSPLPFSSYL